MGVGIFNLGTTGGGTEALLLTSCKTLTSASPCRSDTSSVLHPTVLVKELNPLLPDLLPSGASTSGGARGVSEHSPQFRSQAAGRALEEYIIPQSASDAITLIPGSVCGPVGVASILDWPI